MTIIINSPQGQLQIVLTWPKWEAAAPKTLPKPLRTEDNPRRPAEINGGRSEGILTNNLMVMWLKQCHKLSPETIFIGDIYINHSQSWVVYDIVFIAHKKL